ncbi:sulfatase [Paenibacillus sp. CGMCC 1.16610]|uniref:Sulfatase-like hydrolase/transferase n=1 Tax=Paenibacillus anseongense TaxID=2682845 RepID=A0ABW9U9X8_9BACL|nr:MULTISPECIES: sulfatase [Paenibacillus]MBA2938657.1 sulfatase [Paenibacillus sp. CGMCC 1.16610]MVQ34620.1 sulfatase-like hydrolase/transferase [Paenibacillus anseongense]
MDKPNILFMISHDTGRYLGSYGKQVETPNLDNLAAKGVRFDQYFCPAPQCSPSRGSIITGLYPHNHGMIGLAHLGFSMNPDVATLPKELQKHGYETSLIGFSHETIDEPDSRLTSSTYKLGYEHVLPVAGDRGPDVARKVVQYLEEKAAAADSGPFFASVGFFETHRDFDEYEAIADPIDQVIPPPYLPDTPKVREDFALLHGSVKVLDQSIGHIIKSLKETGLDKNTLVIYTTDHGIAFPRAKGTLMDAGLETGLIMYYPGRIEGGKVVDQLLCNIDLMPTLLDFVGADSPEGIDGRSFLPILDDTETKQPTRDHFFSELTWHDLYHPMRSIRTEKYKYIRNFEDGPSVYLPLDIHRSLSGGAVREEYYVPNVPEELYDLEKDPLETCNLVGIPAYKEVLEELRARVDGWMAATKDPLLHGEVAGIAAPEWEEQFGNGSAYSYKRK